MVVVLIILLILAYLFGIGLDLRIFQYLWLLYSFIVLYLIIIDGFKILKRKPTAISFFVFFIFYFILIILEPLTSIINTGDVSYSIKLGVLSNSSLLISGLCHSVFLLIVMIFRLNLNINKFDFFKTKPPIISFKLIILLFVLLIIGLYPYFREGLGGMVRTMLMSRSESNSQFRNTGMASSDFAVHLTTILISLGSICGYYLIYGKPIKRHYKYLVFFLLVICVLVVGSSGTRTRIILLISPILSYILFVKAYGIKEIPVRRIIIILISGLFVLSIMAEYRKIGFNSISSNDTTKLNFDGLDLNNEFIYTIEHFDEPVNKRNFLQVLVYPIPEQTIKFVTNPIPRMFFPNKYLDPSFAPFNEKRIGKSGLAETFNITPTIFGRFYLLYGIVGIIYMSIFVGYFLKLINSNINNSKNLNQVFLNLCFLAFMCQSIRDLSPGWFYAFIFTYFIFKIFKYFRIDV